MTNHIDNAINKCQINNNHTHTRTKNILQKNKIIQEIIQSFAFIQHQKLAMSGPCQGRVRGMSGGLSGGIGRLSGGMSGHLCAFMGVGVVDIAFDLHFVLQ